jgi:hypothetical protein
MTSNECIDVYIALLTEFAEAGWTQEELGWFLLGSSVTALTKSGIPRAKVDEAITALHAEAAKQPDSAN